VSAPVVLGALMCWLCPTELVAHDSPLLCPSKIMSTQHSSSICSEEWQYTWKSGVSNSSIWVGFRHQVWYGQQDTDIRIKLVMVLEDAKALVQGQGIKSLHWHVLAAKG